MAPKSKDMKQINADARAEIDAILDAQPHKILPCLQKLKGNDLVDDEPGGNTSEEWDPHSYTLAQCLPKYWVMQFLPYLSKAVRPILPDLQKVKKQQALDILFYVMGLSRDVRFPRGAHNKKAFSLMPEKRYEQVDGTKRINHMIAMVKENKTVDLNSFGLFELVPPAAGSDRVTKVRRIDTMAEVELPEEYYVKMDWEWSFRHLDDIASIKKGMSRIFVGELFNLEHVDKERLQTLCDEARRELGMEVILEEKSTEQLAADAAANPGPEAAASATSLAPAAKKRMFVEVNADASTPNSVKKKKNMPPPPSGKRKAATAKAPK